MSADSLLLGLFHSFALGLPPSGHCSRAHIATIPEYSARQKVISTISFCCFMGDVYINLYTVSFALLQRAASHWFWGGISHQLVVHNNMDISVTEQLELYHPETTYLKMLLCGYACFSCLLDHWYQQIDYLTKVSICLLYAHYLQRVFWRPGFGVFRVALPRFIPLHFFISWEKNKNKRTLNIQLFHMSAANSQD